MKVFHFPVVLLMFISLSANCQLRQKTDISGIEGLIRKGNFTEASQQIDRLRATNTLTETENYQLLFQQDVFNRIRLDFSLSEKDIREKLKPYFPNVSDN